MQPTNPSPTGPRPQRPQYFDVMRPGRTPASPNSRPVLASNRPPVPDTSMKQGAPAVPTGFVSAPVAPPAPVQPAVTLAASATIATPPQPRPAPAPHPAVVLGQPAASAPAAQDVGQVAVDGQVGPATADPALQSSPSPAQSSPSQAPAKHSVLSEMFAVFAIILLIAVIINILLDAEVINLPIPHTNFFDY